MEHLKGTVGKNEILGMKLKNYLTKNNQVIWERELLMAEFAGENYARPIDLSSEKNSEQAFYEILNLIKEEIREKPKLDKDENFVDKENCFVNLNCCKKKKLGIDYWKNNLPVAVYWKIKQGRLREEKEYCLSCSEFYNELTKILN